jgi:hypothetical protein
MGISVSNAEAVNDGKHVAQMYWQEYGESQSKHKQTISGNVILPDQKSLGREIVCFNKTHNHIFNKTHNFSAQ